MRLRRLPDAPFLVDSLRYRIDDDTWRLSIVCKATYSLHEGQCAFAAKPIDIFVDEQYFDPSGMLYAPRDVLPAKARPEVIVVRPATEEARMSLEGANIPLRPPLVKTNGQALMSLAQMATQPLGGFDAEQFQFAAREQWLDKLPIGPPFTLHRAHPLVPELTTRLPPHQPVLRVERASDTSLVVPLLADLLWLDVERDVLTVTWRGQVHHDFNDSLVLALGVDDGRRSEWPDTSVAPTTLSQNGQSPSLETTVRSAGVPQRTRPKAKTEAMLAFQPRSSDTSPGLPAITDGLPTWLDRKPLPRPSSPPPRNDGGRSSPPPPLPHRAEPSTPSVRPSAPLGPPPSHRGSWPPSSWPPAAPPGPAPPQAPPPPAPLAAPAMMAPARVSGAPGPNDRLPPPTSARAVSPPNPARALIEMRQEAPPPSVLEDEQSGVRKPPGTAALALDLLWASEHCVSRIRHHHALEKFLPEEPEPPPSHAPILGTIDRQSTSAPRAEPDDRVIRRVLRDADTTALVDLRDLLLQSARDEAQPDLVVVMLEGELVISYDQRAALKIMTDTARPLADPKSRELASAVENVERVIDTPLAEDAGILKSMTDQLLDAWTSKRRDLPKDFLAEHTRRLLLKQRHHRKQRVLGDTCVRAFFRHGSEEVPVYLPAAAEARLPSMFSFEARVLAEIVPRQDEVEACRVALVPLAVARRIDSTLTK